ncbi:hypothetical protein Tco_1127921 [Tanacetum coccineum]
MDAGIQDSYVSVSSGKDKGPSQEYIMLLLQPHRTMILVKDVVRNAQEQPSANASPDKGIQLLEDVCDKEGQHQIPEDEQVWQSELEMMVTACSFMLCDLDFEPLSLSLSSLPSCDLMSLTNMLILLHYLESFKSEFAEVFVFKS